MRRRHVLVGLLALGGCAPQRLPAPPAAPRVVSAAELVPADLDVVARIDLSRMRAALGSLTEQLLSRDVLSRASADGKEPDELVVRSLLEADVAYLGYRPSPLLLPLDRVLALQGRFTPITRAPAGFSPDVDVGADVRYWDRRATEGLPRSDTARLYAVGNRVRAFVSEAELDSVERALDGLSEPRPLVAPEEGTLSLAARPRLLTRFVSGTLRELLSDSKALQVVVDLESDDATLRASLETASAEHAAGLAKAAEVVVSSVLGDRATRARVVATESRVTLSLRLSRAELAALLPSAR
jgi:hypothetical protein